MERWHERCTLSDTIYLCGSHFLHLDQQVQENCSHHLGFVVQTVFEADHDFFHHGVAEGVVQDDCQTLPTRMCFNFTPRDSNLPQAGSERAPPTLKTEQRTSSELVSFARSLASFFRKSTMTTGGRSSQHLARILQTPKVAMQRTVG